MKIHWKPESFTELTKIWNEYWEYAEFEEESTDEIELKEYVQTMNSLYINGGIILKCFDIPYSVVLDYYFHELTQHFDKTTFFINFFLSESVKKSIPEYKLSGGLVYLPQFNLDISFNDKEGAFTIFKNLLINGGAYRSFNGSEELANTLVKNFCEKVFGVDFTNILIFSTHECWNDWFCDVAWDYSYIIINRNNFKLWVLGITDTD
jgi:hypothetical protein